MEDQTPIQPIAENSQQTGTQLTLQNSGGVLSMGIISLVTICCLPITIVSITLSILALVFGSRAMTEYGANPSKYTIKSYKNVKAGRTCAIISLVFNGLAIIILLIYLSTIGFAIGALLSSIPWESI